MSEIFILAVVAFIFLYLFSKEKTQKKDKMDFDIRKKIK